MFTRKGCGFLSTKCITRWATATVVSAAGIGLVGNDIKHHHGLTIPESLSRSPTEATAIETAQSSSLLDVSNTTSRVGGKSLVIFSGGSGFNNAARVLQEEQMRQLASLHNNNPSSLSIATDVTSPALPSVYTPLPIPLQASSLSSPQPIITTSVSYILPVSDDGGSSSEIIRVLDGPAIGDVRSRLLRLTMDETDAGKAVKRILEHRLTSASAVPVSSSSPSTSTSSPSSSSVSSTAPTTRVARVDEPAYLEWSSILDGTHPLWSDIPWAYKATLRRFLAVFNDDVCKAADRVTPGFDFRNGSIGNFFFTGSRRFFNSIEAAIFWFARVAGIPRSSSVVPCILTDTHVGIAAKLCNGEIIVGQSNISHPVPSAATITPLPGSTFSSLSQSATLLSAAGAAKVVGTGAEKMMVDKHDRSVLPSPIDQIFYCDKNGRPTPPSTNPRVLKHLRKASAVVYGMGSLYTSVVPSLVLEGVGEVIKENRSAQKVLVMNTSTDRETHGMTPADFVVAVTRALDRYNPAAANANAGADASAGAGAGACGATDVNGQFGPPPSISTSPSSSSSSSFSCQSPTRYVNTLIVPTNCIIPPADSAALNAWGIRVIRVDLAPTSATGSGAPAPLFIPYNDAKLAKVLLSL